MEEYKSCCKAVMYHYIRNENNSANLKFLHVSDFEQQLDFFWDEYWFVNQKDWINYIQWKSNLPRWIILTFDDWLIDHHKYVLPILNRRNLWWIFYISSWPLESEVLLDVHSIHYLLAEYWSEFVYEIFCQIIKEKWISISYFTNQDAYKMQDNDFKTDLIKKINYISDCELKSNILMWIMNILRVDSSQLHKKRYMDKNQISDIIESWSIIWWHSRSHHLLTTVPNNKLIEEINQSNIFLQNQFGVEINTFCYPFWWSDSFNKDVIDSLNNSIQYSFCVDPKDISKSDIVNRKYSLPRYDCNLFKYWQCRN